MFRINIQVKADKITKLQQHIRKFYNVRNIHRKLTAESRCSKKLKTKWNKLSSSGKSDMGI